MNLERGCVVRVVRGRKVPIGTVATVFWYGETRYGTRLGIKVEGSEEALWTAATNVVVIEEAPARGEAPVGEVVPVAALPEVMRGVLVRVVAGRPSARGAVGRVFWEGVARGGGRRFGMKEEGSTEAIWVNASEIEVWTPAVEPVRAMVAFRAPNPAAPPVAEPVWHEAEVVAPAAPPEMIQKPLVWE